MATEQILDGQYFRRLKDATNNVWERLSFWTKAKDVYLENNTNLETKIASLEQRIAALEGTSSAED